MPNKFMGKMGKLYGFREKSSEPKIHHGKSMRARVAAHDAAYGGRAIGKDTPVPGAATTLIGKPRDTHAIAKKAAATRKARGGIGNTSLSAGVKHAKKP